MVRQDPNLAASSREVGALMRDLREARDISLTEMARQVRYSKGHLSIVERGNSFPPRELLERYEEVLDLPEGQLQHLWCSKRRAQSPATHIARRSHRAIQATTSASSAEIQALIQQLHLLLASDQETLFVQPHLLQRAATSLVAILKDGPHTPPTDLPDFQTLDADGVHQEMLSNPLSPYWTLCSTFVREIVFANREDARLTLGEAYGIVERALRTIRKQLPAYHPPSPFTAWILAIVSYDLSLSEKKGDSAERLVEKLLSFKQSFANSRKFIYALALALTGGQTAKEIAADAHLSVSEVEDIFQEIRRLWPQNSIEDGPVGEPAPSHPTSGTEEPPAMPGRDSINNSSPSQQTNHRQNGGSP